MKLETRLLEGRSRCLFVTRVYKNLILLVRVIVLLFDGCRASCFMVKAGNDIKIYMKFFELMHTNHISRQDSLKYIHHVKVIYFSL